MNVTATLDGETVTIISMEKQRLTVFISYIDSSQDLKITEIPLTDLPLVMATGSEYAPGVAVAAQSIISQDITPNSIDEDGYTATVIVTFKDANGKDTEDLGGQALTADGVKWAGTWTVTVSAGTPTATATYTSGVESQNQDEDTLAVKLDGTAIGDPPGISTLTIVNVGGCGCG